MTGTSGDKRAEIESEHYKQSDSTRDALILPQSPPPSYPTQPGGRAPIARLESLGASTTSLSWSGRQAHAFQVQKSKEAEDMEENGSEVSGSAGSVTRPLVITALASILGSSFAQGWGTGVLNSPAALIKSFLNESYMERRGVEVCEEWMVDLMWAVTVAIFLLGGCAGAFSAGFFADKFGRKRALLICLIFQYFSAALFLFCRLARSFEMLMLARLIMGYGCGAGSGLVPMYLTEIAPVKIRGAMGTLHQFSVTFGILLSQIFGLSFIFGNERLWPVLLCFYAVPCTLSLVILPFFPDSPRFLLINKENLPQAEHALRLFRGEQDVSQYIDEMTEDARIQKSLPKWTMKMLIRSVELRKPLLLLLALSASQQLSGINAVFFYSTSIFESAGIPSNYVQYANIATGLINVFMTMISVRLVDKSGRRPLLLGGMLLMIISSILLTVALNVQHLLTWISYLSIVCLVTFVIGFAIGLGSIPQFIGAELFRQGPRPAAMSLAGLLNWSANFSVGISFPSIQGALQAYTFLLFTSTLVLSLVLFWFKLPETKNKTYDEIYADMKLTATTTTQDKEKENLSLLPIENGGNRETLPGKHSSASNV